MKHPPLLLTVGLILWGWQTNQLVIAIIMALAIEYSRWCKWRCEINDKNFNRIADITSIIFLFFIVYEFSSKSAHGIFIILASLPYVFFILITAQLYSQKGTVQLSALFISLRNQNKNLLNDYPLRIDLTYPYLFICILSASSGNKNQIIFFICICLILSYALYNIRPKRYKLGLWLFILSITFLFSYLGQQGLQIVQSRIELMAGDFLEQMLWRSRDPDKTYTAIGTIGKLKLSDLIHVRVKTEQKLDSSLLLREASYTKYAYGTWSNNKKTFTVIDPEIGDAVWNIGPKPDEDKKYIISTKFLGEKSVIPIPHGTYRISDVNAIDIDRNGLGTVNMDLKPGWIEYSAHAGSSPILDDEPTEDDLHIESIYEPVITKIANELGLFSKSPDKIVEIIESYFEENFSYSLIQTYRFRGTNKLADFLLYRKKGHCEYFATTTTLLLRAAGIPARYTVGYSITEYSRLEKQYIARARDAHSWVNAYVNGQWKIIDTTPGIWIPLEAEGEPWWLPLADIWSWLQYLVSRWEDYKEKDGGTIIVWGSLIFIIVYVCWRVMYRKLVIRKHHDKPKLKIQIVYSGMDSPFYNLINYLEKRTSKRSPGETIRQWIKRINNQLENTISNDLIDMHYKYRFDPKGPDEQEKKDFMAKVNYLIASPISR